jgi:hypothetical protein
LAAVDLGSAEQPTGSQRIDGLRFSLDAGPGVRAGRVDRTGLEVDLRTERCFLSRQHGDGQ